ncbi:hypothetical protein CXF94_16850 [Halomonas sp. Choline-3u-9]|nr:hypothetical protein CXF94_16850 [Halomonas sp. Choline-3u-9]QGQ72072.1 hypothetical protein FDY98_22220 [Halomonas sp. PA16-9]
MSEGQTRQKSTKKRSLRVVNEHFEAIFNAVWSSAIVNQRFPNNPKQTAASQGQQDDGVGDKRYHARNILLQHCT